MKEIDIRRVSSRIRCDLNEHVMKQYHYQYPVNDAGSSGVEIGASQRNIMHIHDLS